MQLAEFRDSGRERVAVLSHGVWQRRFRGDPKVVSRSLSLNGEPFTVVGVMDRDFLLPGAQDRRSRGRVLDGRRLLEFAPAARLFEQPAQELTAAYVRGMRG